MSNSDDKKADLVLIANDMREESEAIKSAISNMSKLDMRIVYSSELQKIEKMAADLERSSSLFLLQVESLTGMD